MLAFWRWRFVAFAADQRQSTTLALLAEVFAALDGVPARVLADRMGCLKGGVVAGVMVPTAEYVRFATHYGFRPTGTPQPRPAGDALILDLPTAPTRSLDAGLRRLKLAAARRTAPEVLQVAKTQRWIREEVLRTLIEAKLAACDSSNARIRLKAAAFPVLKPSTASTSPHHRSRKQPSTTCPGMGSRATQYRTDRIGRYPRVADRVGRGV